MSDYRFLDATLHANAGWLRPTGVERARSDAVAEIVLAELGKVLPLYVVAFARTDESTFRLVVLQGLKAGENLFLSKDGNWLAKYVPSIYRAYPFRLQSTQHKGKLALALGFDFASGLYCDALDAVGVERFFDADGKLAEAVAGVREFCLLRLQQQKLTQRAVQALVDHELLSPLGLAHSGSSAEDNPLTGLYGVEEAKLFELDAEALHALQKNRALGLAYAQILSLSRVSVLEQLRRMQRPEVSADIVEELFGDDDGILKFD